MDKFQVGHVDAEREIMKLLWSEKVQGEFLPARVEEDRGKRGK
jgi:hypothetical protein